MVRSATTRKEKYNAKLRGSVWNARFTELKDIMVEQTGHRYPEQVYYETKVKAYCEAQGMYGLQLHHYLNFAFRLWSFARRFTQATLRNEAIEEANKWVRRGLTATHLVEIAKLFGIDLAGI